MSNASIHNQYNAILLFLDVAICTDESSSLQTLCSLSRAGRISNKVINKVKASDT